MSTSSRIAYYPDLEIHPTVFDFQVDGEWIVDKIMRVNSETFVIPDDIKNRTGLCGGFTSHYFVPQSETMIGVDESGAFSGFVPVTACGDFGWIGCGAIWSRITIEDDVVTWKEFGWRDRGLFLPTSDLAFSFNRIQYIGAIRIGKVEQ